LRFGYKMLSSWGDKITKDHKNRCINQKNTVSFRLRSSNSYKLALRANLVLNQDRNNYIQINTINYFNNFTGAFCWNNLIFPLENTITVG